MDLLNHDSTAIRIADPACNHMPPVLHDAVECCSQMEMSCTAFARCLRHDGACRVSAAAREGMLVLQPVSVIACVLGGHWQDCSEVL